MTTAPIGVLLSIVAMFGWALADFLIQKNGRLMGAWNAMFWSALFGLMFLTPFVWRDLPAYVTSPTGQWLIFLMAIVVTLTVVTSYLSLIQGKLSVISPIFGLEVPVTVLIGSIMLREFLPGWQLVLVAVVFFGIGFGMWRHGPRTGWLERGALLGIAGAVMLAVNNVLVGYTSRHASPLLNSWIGQVIIVLIAFVAHRLSASAEPLAESLRKHPGMLLAGAAVGVAPWIAFGFATQVLPVAIATTISEGYIVLGVVMGVMVNKERLRRRQWFGILIAIAGILTLSALTAF